MICPHCGRENPPNLIYCSGCFQRLFAWLGDPFGAADTPEDTASRHDAPSAARPAPAARGGFAWRYVFAGCGCLAILFVGFLFLLGAVAILASGSLTAQSGRATVTPTQPVTRAVSSATAMPQAAGAVATASALMQTGERVFGPVDGALAHRTDNVVATRSAAQRLRDFAVEARFHNPWSAAEGAFDYGFLFRQTGRGQSYRLRLSSNGSWILQLVDMPADQAVFTEVARGTVTLNTAPDGRNDLILLAREGTSYFYVNGRLVAALDISAKQDAGGLSIGTGFARGSQREGHSTRYENLTVWSLPAPEEGAP